MQSRAPQNVLKDQITGISPSEEAAAKMYETIKKMHALGDKKIVPVTKRDAMGGRWR